MSLDAQNVLDLFAYIIRRLDRIDIKVSKLLTTGDAIMADLTALTSQVQQNTTVEQSAMTLIQGLASQITAAGNDPKALQALVTQLQSSASSLAAAVAANTPAAPGGGGTPPGGGPVPPTPTPVGV